MCYSNKSVLFGIDLREEIHVSSIFVNGYRIDYSGLNITAISGHFVYFEGGTSVNTLTGETCGCTDQLTITVTETDTGATGDVCLGNIVIGNIVFGDSVGGDVYTGDKVTTRHHYGDGRCTYSNDY